MTERTHEVGESLEADFEKGEWTFRMTGYYQVSAGHYALVPLNFFKFQTERLERSEDILRSLRKHAGLGDNDNEMIDKFFDPEPL